MNEIIGQNALAETQERRPAPRRQQSYLFSDLLIPLSTAVDLAEGREPGHAQRVAYISLALANNMGLDSSERLSCAYAALMHDAGVIASAGGLAEFARGDERMVFAPMPLLSPEEAAQGTESPEDVAQRIVDHVIHGARVAQELALPQEAVLAISAHHERWDGSGYPHGLRGDAIPLLGGIVGLADQVEALAADSTPLFARRSFATWMARLAGRDTDPALVEAMRDLGRNDDFWLGLYSDDMSQELSRQCLRLKEPRGAKAEPFIESFADMVDARLGYTSGVSHKVARLAERLGAALGFDEPHLRLLRAAAYLHDVGQLSVSERIMAKPAILTVDELEVLRMHPVYSHDVVAGIAGLEQVAEWVASHHERVDGRGYPDGRAGHDIPVEARILNLVDTYVAITSDRPHRQRADAAEARRMLRSAAGSQLDTHLVDVFLKDVIG